MIVKDDLNDWSINEFETNKKVLECDLNAKDRIQDALICECRLIIALETGLKCYGRFKGFKNANIDYLSFNYKFFFEQISNGKKEY